MSGFLAIFRRPLPPWLRRLPLWLAPILVLLLPAVGAAQAPAAERAPLLLLGRQTAYGLWPNATVWFEPSGRVDVLQALRQRADFVRPTGPTANLGVHREAVWLHVPLRVPTSGDDRWIFDIDYPALDRIEVYVVADGRVQQQVLLGDHLPMSQRPLATRTHAARLNLPEGQALELLVRVESASTLILPLELAREEVYHAREAGHEAVQGLLAGVGLCLLIYSLVQWLLMSEVAFGFYALNVAGIVVFFFNHFGLATQHLWPESVWLTDKASPASVLLALVGGMLFIDRVLQVRRDFPRASLVLRVCALAALGVSLLFLLDLVGYRVAQASATVLGPVPMLLGVPVAWIRARRGDRAALFIFLGWGLYAVGVVVMAAFLRGHAPVNGWTQHSLQMASMAEMAMWMAVLGVRMEGIRHAAEQAQREQDRLQLLASTDPLTGALNRRGLQAALGKRLARCDEQHQAAVFLLDLDGFKPVNDRLGHDAGDELLVGVAVRLRGCVRESDLVARVGGDEFVVVVDGLPDGEMAQRIGQKLLAAFEAPFQVADDSCCVGATIGYALSPSDARLSEELLRLADSAMYQGKQAGRRQVRRLEQAALQPA
ncbi:MAG TPA: diguanylate cyclase [Burkholderiaceae bacterium]|nr:diguanylate cyclase [Burkholderiaceae bacterium]HMX11776.1 diguanylate cyclase [Burkholderiaceae bacterium]HMY99083.1 diguanylate cyclase [Burkholderiaceae bacterium]HNG80117.1 diguanylate cyclase [Burkholderiaceae bacterium]